MKLEIYSVTIVTWDDGFLGQRAAAGAALAGDLRTTYAVCFQQEEWEEEVGLIKFTFGSENNMRSALFACFDSHGPSGVFGHELFALHIAAAGSPCLASVRNCLRHAFFAI
jgi:hypothetical protein